MPTALTAAARKASMVMGRAGYCAPRPRPSEAEGHLRREAARRRHVELRVAELALRRVVTAVAEVPPHDGETAPREVPRRAGVPLVERAGEERVAPVQGPPVLAAD